MKEQIRINIKLINISYKVFVRTNKDFLKNTNIFIYFHPENFLYNPASDCNIHMNIHCLNKWSINVIKKFKMKYNKKVRKREK